MAQGKSTKVKDPPTQTITWEAWQEVSRDALRPFLDAWATFYHDLH